MRGPILLSLALIFCSCSSIVSACVRVPTASLTSATALPPSTAALCSRCSYTEYYLNAAHAGLTAYTATSGTLSVACGRLSFTLGLKARARWPNG